MSEKELVFLHCSELDQIDYPPECPFSTQRAGKARKIASSMGLLSGAHRRVMPPVRLTREELEAFHTPSYLDAMQEAEKGNFDIDALKMGLGTLECPIFLGMVDYATLAAGGSTTGARLLLAGDADLVFNPSGGFHHAAPGCASGFCYINDIVLAALVLSEAGKRVLFLDLDVHHCDGVQDAFYERSDIMTISLHESGKTLFPGTGFEDEIGSGEGRGYTANVPLPVGTYDAAYHVVFNQIAIPLMKRYDPDVIILELGMDALAGDPLAHLQLTNNVCPDIIKQIMDLGKPILATGGGGYHVGNTVKGWALAWSVMCGEEDDDLYAGVGGTMHQEVKWAEDLRDKPFLPEPDECEKIDREILGMVKTVRELHGIS